ncbi:iron/manganese transporter [Flavobacterium columnare]|uniref:Divalent metal cation transporter MntH n=1 Tax=Flavobacterium columnare TaxID=996 RepID=A0AA94EXP0_9FLAO|nr:Nramp family divalent metal transporter [Flavobacterium columnare]AMO20565.1 iron/manganese transporter [Flavobacterium columnare]ANO47089.1 manganese transport protein mntH [Flavobacterium columnare]APT22222.1 iron/manganese transporter [Flavobacterium columnare]AUX18538.1 iron/manganese transporter [Flavobacterium columnare]MBF6653198.1 iron/manganese transporter [Flavobacterium columnare]
MSKSLEEVHESVSTQNKTSWFKRTLAFLGPAYLISVGYMDPGNWATDLAGGSQFGYSLLWVLLMSNLMALLLQSLSARLGIVTQRDLAQASRETYSPLVNLFLYILAEIAIAACDLAEVLGMAIGINLLFGIPLLQGVMITVLDTFLLLFLINKGIRKMEAFVVTLVAIIGSCFVFEMVFAQPEIAKVASGLIPSIPDQTALYIAIGIIGATVMPHNLYLHSSLVQTRKFERSRAGIKQAIRYNIIDSTIALNLAFFVNAAILILAAAAFYKNGLYEVAEIQDAYQLLTPMLGTKWAASLFAIALIAAGQSSTITGTLAGQIVMEGYLNLRIQPWVRRILTRLIAIVPAVIVITLLGEEVTGKMLIFSQVILSMQLGFAIIPLIHFVSDPEKMNGFQINKLTQVVAWIIALIIVGLNAKLVFGEIQNILQTYNYAISLWLTIVPISIGFGLLLLYIIFKPLLKPTFNEHKHTTHQNIRIEINPNHSICRKNIAVALDFSTADALAVNHAIELGGKDADYTLIHIVESVGAIFYGQHIKDQETKIDKKILNGYRDNLVLLGYKVECQLGFGNPTKAIADIINTNKFDILVMGTHGHTGYKDILFGTTVDKLRHAISIPLYIVKKEENSI